MGLSRSDTGSAGRQRDLGLPWIRELADGDWVVFRGAELRLYEMDRSLFEQAMQPDLRLVGRIGLTDDCGWPRCATVRPPDIVWSVEYIGRFSATSRPRFNRSAAWGRSL